MYTGLLGKLKEKQEPCAPGSLPCGPKELFADLLKNCRLQACSARRCPARFGGHISSVSLFGENFGALVFPACDVAQISLKAANLSRFDAIFCKNWPRRRNVGQNRSATPTLSFSGKFRAKSCNFVALLACRLSTTCLGVQTSCKFRAISCNFGQPSASHSTQASRPLECAQGSSRQN